MTDTSPEALDALEKRLRIRGAQPHERSNHYVRRMEIERHEAAAAIRALRVAPVAMRERIARAEDEAYARGEMGNPGHRIRALPLDAPAPVNPRFTLTTSNAAISAAFWAGHAAGVRGEDVELAWLTQPDLPAPVDPAWDRVAQGVFHDEQHAPVDPVAEATQVLQRAILTALAAVPEEGWCVGLRGLSGRTGLSREVCRAIVADLRAAGLASYHKGLWSDDERPAGAGYAITAEGRALAQEALHEG
jgi:hypothetical protein